MNRYAYSRPADLVEAVRLGAADPGARFIAGGSNLVDLIKYDVERPTRLIDISRIPGLDRIEPTSSGGLRIGALASNSDVAYDERVQRDYPLLSRAILSGASPQLRNMASTGGNLLQRTRCYYFYDPATPCNKREPGSGCPAITGLSRIHAVLGTSEQCIATHPSDMCVALAALEATIHVVGPTGERSLAMADFHRLPGDTPHIETALRPGELVTGVELPAQGFAAHHTYLKLRDRLSYAFALVAVAVGLAFEGDRIGLARLALGGVAAKPWRVPEAEALLAGHPPDRARFAAAAERLLAGATGTADNAFKIDLARRAIIRALTQASSGHPQSVADKRVA